MSRIRVGVQLRPQHTTYARFADAVRRVEELGVDTIWTWDHFYPLSGEPEGLHFEGWTLLTAMATLTTRAEIGLLVTCTTYRNPNLLADMARTVDHISGGRAILGIGAGWFQKDYAEYGYEFGTAPDRLRALARDLPIIRERWTRLNPPPVRQPIPILIGGGGEKVTLRLVAQYAQLWHGFGDPATFKHKCEVLDDWCRQYGRDPGSVERVAGANANQLDQLDAYIEAGAGHVIMGVGDPWDYDAVERLVRWRDSRA